MRFALLVIALFAAVPAAATPASDLQAVLTDHWRWYLTENPVEASALGDHGGDGRLRDVSLAAEDRRADAAHRFVDRLNAIPDSGLDTEGRTNKAVLVRMLADRIAENQFGERMILFTTYAGWYQDFASLVDNSPFATRADYESYLARLAAYPRLNADAIEITRQAIAGGFMQPCSVLAGIPKSISGVVADAPERSRFYEPFTRKRPADISDATWTGMLKRARSLIAGTVEPEYRMLAAFYARDYQPKCRTTVGAAALPQGSDWYRLQVRIHTTTDLTPEAIHALGLSEVARIGTAMDAAAKSAGFADATAYSTHLRADPASYATSVDALLGAAALETKKHDGLMPRFFATLPRLPYGVRPIPAETAEQTTAAYYGPGAPASGIAGTLWINTSKLDQRPLWELPALTAHEGVPGHHNQIARAQELDLPPFRRYAQFTAFVEGWALYSEALGEEMGLYDTPAKKMGRLSLEAWRGCRLVVDTGLHSQGWTKAQAIAFMRAHTALSDANIEAEVNRYISWPGQALGYKIGEIKIRELRARAEKDLGPKFDLRRFHDAVLAGGAMPLDVLDTTITRWIATQR